MRIPGATRSGADMSVTKRLSPEGMEDYFIRFNKRFLRSESTDVADVEVLSSELGDQIAANGAHLLGITYDPNTRSLEVELESGDHRAFTPKEVWAIEDDDGFVRAIEIIRDDDASEIVRVRRIGVQRAD
jgi:Family of unknown function (DUF5335)